MLPLPLQIDGTDYSSAVIVDTLAEDGELMEGIAHMTRQDGTEWYDVIGTRFTRTVELRRNRNGNRTLWDQLYSVLTQSVGTHTVTLGSRTFAAHITVASRELRAYTDDGVELWGDSYTVTFEGSQPEVV